MEERFKHGVLESPKAKVDVHCGTHPWQELLSLMVVKRCCCSSCKSISRFTIKEKDLLAGALKDFDAIVVRSATKISREILLNSGSRLKVIGRAGVGVDNIDITAAAELNIPVVNAPRASTQSVIELTIGHLLSSLRHIPRADRSMRLGKWEKKSMKGTELFGKDLGLIGFGRIAQGVGSVAQLLGMEVIPTTRTSQQKSQKHKTRHCTSILTQFFKIDSHFHYCFTEETHHLHQNEWQ